MSTTCSAAVAAFRAAVEAGDVEAAVAQFGDDVEFVSPVVHRPYQGREALRAILEAVFTVFEDFRYEHAYAGDDGHVLEFTARVDDLALQGIDILRPGPDGLRQLTVMIRPYSAATALRERMAALLSG